MKSEVYERILDCRYYTGEANPPTGPNAMFWHYECGWANGKHDNWEDEKKELDNLGLTQWLYEYDGTQPDFKCLLFNRYCHWVGIHDGTDDFLRWYADQYVRPRLTNRQRRANERKKKLTAMCRYYKGEQKNPYEGTPDHTNWYYESCWVELLSQSYEKAKIFRQEVGNHLDDIAEKYNVPRSLIGLFLNRYEHCTSTGEVNLDLFRGWLLRSYLKIEE